MTLRRSTRTVVLRVRTDPGQTARVLRRRVGHRRWVRVRVRAHGIVRDRRLRPGALYEYRISARDPAGHWSRPRLVRVHTRRTM